MDFLIFTIYKAFNSGKQKGFFLDNFRWLFVLYLNYFIGAIIILFDALLDIQILPKNLLLTFESRVFFIVGALIYILIFYHIGGKIVTQNRITEAISKYGHLNWPNYVWVILFFAIHFFVGGLTWFVGYCFNINRPIWLNH